MEQQTAFKTAAHQHTIRHLTSTTAFIPQRDWQFYNRVETAHGTYKWQPSTPPPQHTHNPPLPASEINQRLKRLHRRPPLGTQFFRPRSPSLSSNSSTESDPISDSLSGSSLSNEASHSDDSSITSTTIFDPQNYYHNKLLLNSAYSYEF